MKSFVADDGQRIHVHVRGHGPPVVLLHGWVADHSMWHPVTAELAHRFTVYAWDARGHAGHPLEGREPPVVARMARDLRALIAHFGLHRPVLVGHSMGALVLWQAVADGGCDGLGPLCLIDQSPKLVTDADWRLGIYGDWDATRNHRFIDDLRTDFAESVLRLVAEGRNQRALRQYSENTPAIQRLRAALRLRDPEPHITCWRSLAEADYRATLSRITVPALLVYGEESNYYGPEVPATVSAAIGGSWLRVFEKADHCPHLACRERFVALLGRFADSQNDGGGIDDGAG